jgi:transcriptional regulator of heat shock response
MVARYDIIRIKNLREEMQMETQKESTQIRPQLTGAADELLAYLDKLWDESVFVKDGVVYGREHLLGYLEAFRDCKKITQDEYVQLVDYLYEKI